LPSAATLGNLGLVYRTSGLDRDVQALPVVLGGLGQQAEPEVRGAEVAQCDSRSVEPAAGPRPGGGSGVVLDRDLVSALEPVQVGEAEFRRGLAGLIAGEGGGVEPGCRDRQPLDRAHP
jgi:hypothetical protein